MPNWCENELVIKGKKKDVMRFIDGMYGKGPDYTPHPNLPDELICRKKPVEEYHFNALVPVPKEVEQVGFDGSYRKIELEEILSKYGEKGEDINTMIRIIIINSMMKHPQEELGIIYKKVKEVPMSKIDKKRALKLMGSIRDIPDGYKWQIANWGTKWSADFNDLEISREEIKDKAENEDVTIDIYTESAWSPFDEFVIKAGELFPELTFQLSFAEPGCDFSGTLNIEGGEVVERMQGEYGEYYGERADWFDEDEDE